ncbi:MAG: recombinase family protein [Elusimicrobia bacterium]|nr:recombinase family protein [Elusimicrobiota bacterium]
MKTTAIYVRVSTVGQELNNQIRDLTAYSLKNKWRIYNTYSDVVTGKETREDKRPGFNKLFKDAHKNLFDVVLFWDLSRFSRAGTLYTLQKLQELKNIGIDWVSYQESYFSSLGQFSDVVISIMSTLAKIEREKISERTKSGMRRAIAEGKKIGRPRYSDKIRKEAKRLLKSGVGIRKTSRILKVSPTFIAAL